MTNFVIRTVAIFFALAFAYLSLSFSAGVGENINIVHLILFLLLGVLSQLGLFLSTYQIENWIFKLLIAVIMIPFFMLLLRSTFFDSSFLNRLTGAPIQIASSVAYVVGFAVYLYSFYRMVQEQYNKSLKQDK
jgi:CBS domain containing-hemolysin-like protein